MNKSNSKYNLKIYFLKVLKDDGILATHCMLENTDGIVTLNPTHESAHCFINNMEIKTAHKLLPGFHITTFGI